MPPARQSTLGGELRRLRSFIAPGGFVYRDAHYLSAEMSVGAATEAPCTSR